MRKALLRPEIVSCFLRKLRRSFKARIRFQGGARTTLPISTVFSAMQDSQNTRRRSWTEPIALSPNIARLKRRARTGPPIRFCCRAFMYWTRERKRSGSQQVRPLSTRLCFLRKRRPFGFLQHFSPRKFCHSYGPVDVFG